MIFTKASRIKLNFRENIKKSLIPSKVVVDRDISEYIAQIEQIKSRAGMIRKFTDLELQRSFADLQKNLLEQSTIDQRIQVFAIIYEAVQRTLKIETHDVQLMAGLALDEAKLVEMQTGEGKTLSAVYPAVLNSLSNKPVHIITFNDYLACRDALWMFPVYDFLGIKAGYVQTGMDLEEKKKAYRRQVTYASAKELGFDYLRSFIAYNTSEIAISGLHYAIVDEADAVLIDEARNPLVLAGDTEQVKLDYSEVAAFVRSLKEGVDFIYEPGTRNIFLTDKGQEYTSAHWKVENLQNAMHKNLYTAINLGLEARVLLIKDVDYIVKEGIVQLVDEFTGRVVKDRKWRHGLQTAVEAKENLDIKSEGRILNSITLQHFVNQFQKLAGMTATAVPSAEEFMELYGLKTIVIPPNRPCIRKDHPDLIFSNLEEKESALIKEIRRINQSGQPLLLGTLSVKESERLARKLHKSGIQCKILNARNDEEEAQIIAEAGRLNEVTISTNMAGRGTDIRLEGEDEKEKKQLMQLGGLYVMGTNRHESRRIDLQLRGRAGRQAEPGESRFFVSFEDPLMVKYKFLDLLPKRLKKIAWENPIQNKRIRRCFEIAQKIIEYKLLDMRKNLCLYSNIIEKQRNIVQNERQMHLKENYLSAKIPQEKGQVYKDIILSIYDKNWSSHLQTISEIRDGIYMVQLGGLNPLREFQRQADREFQNLVHNISSEKSEVFRWFEAGDWEKIIEYEVKRPDSTWTYIFNENPFGNQLSLMLLDNSNIGMTVDPVSAFMLFIKALVERRKRKGSLL